MKLKSIDILSLGVGVQSTALYLMSSMGELPRVDYAIFADTGKEKKKTLEYLRDFLLPWQRDNNGIPIVIIQKRNLYKDLLNKDNATGQQFASIPAFTKGEDGEAGMLRRQCTREYKIYQVDQGIRDLYGLKPRQRTPITRVWKGITLDEIDRMNIPQEVWKVSVYPFVGYEVSRNSTEKKDFGRRMTRNDVVNWYKLRGFPLPPKSACTFCPYQSDPSWADMKLNEPEDFAAAIEVDEAIRNSTKKGIKNPAFLHSSLKPLKEIDFKPGAPDLWHGECSGECHI